MGNSFALKKEVNVILKEQDNQYILSISKTHEYEALSSTYFMGFFQLAGGVASTIMAGLFSHTYIPFNYPPYDYVPTYQEVTIYDPKKAIPIFLFGNVLVATVNYAICYTYYNTLDKNFYEELDSLIDKISCPPNWKLSINNTTIVGYECISPTRDGNENLKEFDLQQVMEFLNKNGKDITKEIELPYYVTDKLSAEIIIDESGEVDGIKEEL